MKVYITMEFNAYDREAAPKGEEFDSQLESELTNIEIDGYETLGVRVARSKEELQEKDALMEILDLAPLDVLKHTAAIVEAGRGNEPTGSNPEVTNAQSLAFFSGRLVWYIERAVKERMEKEVAKKEKIDRNRDSRERAKRRRAGDFGG